MRVAPALPFLSKASSSVPFICLPTGLSRKIGAGCRSGETTAGARQISDGSYAPQPQDSPVPAAVHRRAIRLLSARRVPVHRGAEMLASGADRDAMTDLKLSRVVTNAQNLIAVTLRARGKPLRRCDRPGR